MSTVFGPMLDLISEDLEMNNGELTAFNSSKTELKKGLPFEASADTGKTYALARITRLVAEKGVE